MRQIRPGVPYSALVILSTLSGLAGETSRQISCRCGVSAESRKIQVSRVCFFFPDLTNREFGEFLPASELEIFLIRRPAPRGASCPLATQCSAAASIWARGQQRSIEL